MQPYESTNGGKGQNPTATRRSIAQSVCFDCPEQQLHYGDAADAVEASIETAIDHHQRAGHETDNALLVDRQRSVAQTVTGPDAIDTAHVEGDE